VEGEILEPVPQVQEFRAVAAQLAGQLGGGDALGEAADDQDQFPGPALDAVQGRAGKGVEDAVAVAAAEVEHRVAAPTMDDHAVVLMAAGVGHAVGVQPVDELGIARRFIHQVGDRKVHGGLRAGLMRVESPKYPLPRPGCKLPTHQLAYMSQLRFSDFFCLTLACLLCFMVNEPECAVADNDLL
jgi:hypothetical protein